MKPIPKRTLPIEKQIEELRRQNEAVLETADKGVAACDRVLERIRAERENKHA